MLEYRRPSSVYTIRYRQSPPIRKYPLTITLPPFRP
jgi:hypothetical protein